MARKPIFVTERPQLVGPMLSWAMSLFGTGRPNHSLARIDRNVWKTPLKNFRSCTLTLTMRKIIERFAHVDPQRTLRANLDLARLKRRFGSSRQLLVVFDNSIERRRSTTPSVFLNYRREQRRVQLNLVEGNEKFPNLELYRAPEDVAGINTMFSYLGVEELLFSSHSELDEFERQASGLPVDIKINAELKMEASESV